MKFLESSTSYDYPFGTVTLAYFLRYPNPYATHVISTDVIDRHFDSETQTLYTSRLHLKRSKIPATLLRLLPRSWLGAQPAASGDGAATSQSFILERSAVDVARGVMITESRNLELTGVLTVVERQLFRAQGASLAALIHEGTKRMREGYRLAVPITTSELKKGTAGSPDGEEDPGKTGVTTRVELLSSFGEGGRRLLRRKDTKTDAETIPSQHAPTEDADGAVEAPAKVGFFKSLGRGPIQRSIEAIGLRRTERAVPNSHKGMNVVLSRLRQGGLGKVFEEMRRDREMVYAGDGAALKNKYPDADEEE